jgi:hypothetical protein
MIIHLTKLAARCTLDSEAASETKTMAATKD